MDQQEQAGLGFADFMDSAAMPAASSLPEAEPEWIESGLRDDFASLSYEGALRNQGWREPPAQDGVRIYEVESPPPTEAIEQKSARITIRLSQLEVEQLRERAAEARLSLSAYVRSCTFEVETLRAQVKDALAQLRSAAASQSHQPPPAPSKPTGSRWSFLKKGPASVRQASVARVAST